MSSILADFFRCPDALSEPWPDQPLSLTGLDGARHPNLFPGASLTDSVQPFDVSKIVADLRSERYPIEKPSSASAILSNEWARRFYYFLRPMLSHSARKNLQRLFLRDWDQLPFPHWPVDTSVEQLLENALLRSMTARKLETMPFIWFWPDGAHASAMMTHDVETKAGLDFVPQLMDIDDAYDIKSSFQLVPEQRYRVSKEVIRAIRKRHCEVNVHGLNHNGNLFGDRKSFLKQARTINKHVKDFGAEGFRSACMYRNLDWIGELNISYDMSVPNVAHLEPQRGGCCTVFPYFAGRILELPLTTIQDYSLFHIVKDYSITAWKRQIDLIMERHGLISFITHPDYLLGEKELAVYKSLLAYLSQLRSERHVWIARPQEINRWWRDRCAMRVLPKNKRWIIEGRGKERARLAFASIKGEGIAYSLGHGAESPADPRSGELFQYHSFGEQAENYAR